MFPFYDLLALALLLGPPGVVEVTLPAPLYKSLQPALQTVAVRLEILDERELRYLLAAPEDFSYDLHLLRQRRQGLSDAPLLEDCARFPEPPVIDDLIAFNRTYRAQLASYAASDPVHREEWAAAIEETDRLYQVWDTVRCARSDYYYIKDRRAALKRLRAFLGPEAYYGGYLPPSVPVWRFRRID
jgi:hypothetical protein